MAKGEKAFNEQEIKDTDPRGFFNDGETREIVVLNKEVINALGKESNKPYTRVDWTLADCNTGEQKVIKFDFNFTNAMHPFKTEMRYETSQYRVTPTKTGERNGFPIFDYDIEYVGESGNAPIPPSDQPFGDEPVRQPTPNF